MNTPFSRYMQAAGCRTQAELAIFLGIKQSFVSDAQRRGALPPEWLELLEKRCMVNTAWVLYGTEPMHKATTDRSPTESK